MKVCYYCSVSNFVLEKVVAISRSDLVQSAVYTLRVPTLEACPVIHVPASYMSVTCSATQASSDSVLSNLISSL